MVKNPKEKGTNFEREIKNLWVSYGFTVFRQAASLFPDLILMKRCGKHRMTMFIECKNKRGGMLTKEETKRAYELSKEFNASFFLATKEKRGHVIYVPIKLRW